MKHSQNAGIRRDPALSVQDTANIGLVADDTLSPIRLASIRTCT